MARDELHVHSYVQIARFPPQLAKSMRRCRHTGWLQQEKALVVTSDERLASILEKLEECRAGLLASGNRDSAHLVSVAILDVRMRLHRIGDAELRALSEEMLADDGSPGLRDTGLAPGRKRRPLLRLVK